MRDGEGSAGEDEEWREYPVWLQLAVKDDGEQKTVRVIDADDCGGEFREGRGRGLMASGASSFFFFALCCDLT